MAGSSPAMTQVEPVQPDNDDWYQWAAARPANWDVTRGLDPRVHRFSQELFAKKMDCRVKPGNDVSLWFDMKVLVHPSLDALS